MNLFGRFLKIVGVLDEPPKGEYQSYSYTSPDGKGRFKCILCSSTQGKTPKGNTWANKHVGSIESESPDEIKRRLAVYRKINSLPKLHGG